MRTYIESVEPRLFLSATVTGYTFEDANADGIFQSATEHPLAGVTAYVDLNKDGKYQSTEPHSVSNSTGLYTISSSSLTVGKTYTLAFVVPSGFTPTYKLGPVTLGASTTSLAEYGAWRAATVKFSAFLDVNNNHKQDSGEPALANQSIYQDLNGNSQRDANEPLITLGTATKTLKPGRYEFFSTYVTNYRQTLPYSTLPYDLQVTSGQTVNAPFGFYYPARYSGYVYQDKNKNGKYDAGEGLANRRVFADANNSNHWDPGEYGALTDATGYYYDDLNPGSFILRQISPSGWVGSGGQSITVKGSTYTNSTGHNFTSSVSAMPTTGNISGYFFTDANSNGKQDAGETNHPTDFTDDASQGHAFIDHNHNGQADGDDEWLGANADGTFTFTDIAPGTYWLQPYGWTHLNSTTAAKRITVVAGKTTNAGGFGVQTVYVVGVGNVFDANGNGKYDAGDILDYQVPGLQVYIDLNNNGKLDTGEDNLGFNSVFYLPAGTYTFREQFIAGEHESGRSISSTTSTFTSDYKIRLPADTQNFEVSATIFIAPEAVIHGRVFNDINGNGIQDSGETGTYKGGTTIYADYNNNGNQDTNEPGTSLMTDGTFTFGLEPGTYTLRESLDIGWTQTFSSGTTFTVPKTSPSVPTVVFGRHMTAAAPKFFSVNGWAFVDKNTNGKFDEYENEDGDLFSWAVYVDTDKSGDFSEGDLYSDYVSDDGKWGITLPADGKIYRIQMRNEGNTPFTTASYFDVNSTTDGQTLERDFGVAPDTTPYVPATATIKGIAFNDNNKSGVYDTGDTAAAGAEVWIDFNNNGVLDLGDTAVDTAADGSFAFGYLAPGTYHIRRKFAAGYVESTPARAITLTVGQAVTGVTIGSRAK